MGSKIQEDGDKPPTTIKWHCIAFIGEIGMKEMGI